MIHVGIAAAFVNRSFFMEGKEGGAKTATLEQPVPTNYQTMLKENIYLIVIGLVYWYASYEAFTNPKGDVELLPHALKTFSDIPLFGARTLDDIKCETNCNLFQ